MIRAGKREMLEMWAKKENIDIILIQETHVNQAGVERRKEYTIFFSENDKLLDDAGNQKKITHAGVAIMVRNKLLDSILEINPIDDRLMSITLRGAVQTTFINTYMYTAENTENNSYRYITLKAHYIKYKKYGPTFVGGILTHALQTNLTTMAFDLLESTVLTEHTKQPHLKKTWLAIGTS